jgi:hypothetical protein
LRGVEQALEQDQNLPGLHVHLRVDGVCVETIASQARVDFTRSEWITAPAMRVLQRIVRIRPVKAALPSEACC